MHWTWYSKRKINTYSDEQQLMVVGGSNISTLILTIRSGFGFTFNNISVVYRGGQFYWWRKSEYLEETTDRPVASHWQTLSHNVVSSTTLPERSSNSQDSQKHLPICVSQTHILTMWFNVRKLVLVVIHVDVPLTSSNMRPINHIILYWFYLSSQIAFTWYICVICRHWPRYSIFWYLKDTMKKRWEQRLFLLFHIMWQLLWGILTLQDEYNIRTLSENMKSMCTRGETGQHARFSTCF